MNTSIQAKNNNFIFFFGAVLVALLLSGAAAYTTWRAVTGNSDGIPAANKVCIDAIRKSGFSPVINGKTFEVKISRSDKVGELVAKTGVLIASCPAYSLTEFCAGSGCALPGVTFKMTEKSVD